MHSVANDGRAVVHVAGQLDVAGAAPLRRELVRLADADVSDVLVDLTAVTFIDSTGVGVLVGGLKRFRGTGGRLELVVDDARVLRVLRIAGLLRTFTIHASVEQALAAEV
ncbi:STAS domain-containing protein [uncultured Cellulomonas sp.]|uniref:STAS domain-containing protein n=1 Tax=uncultured Cellulomonas sp. TaxID=189682 RepID=UPI0026392F65|nr:STAS domain-containing protein [uncultured Cellulomonas sp.]